MLYQNGKVSVDLTFARFGPKSYAINKINSVEVRERQPYGQGLPVIFGIVAFACLMSILTGSGGLGAGVGVAVFGALTYWAWQRHKILEYRLFLMTSSSEAQALTTRSVDEIGQLRDAIETAMSRQHERAVSVRHEVSLHDDMPRAEEMKPARPGNIRQRVLGSHT